MVLVLSDAVGVFPFGKLFTGRLYDEGVVQVEGAPVGGQGFRRSAGIGDHFGEEYLAGSRGQDVLATHDVGDSLGDVVDADGELVSPETVAVADREVPALEFGALAEIAEAFVVPVDYFVRNYDAKAMGFAAGTRLRAALALVNDFAGFAARVFGDELLSAAGAGIDEPLLVELFEDALEKVKVAALNTFAVVAKTQPGEVLVNAVDVFLTGATLVVVLDTQVNLEVPFLCGGPHV